MGTAAMEATAVSTKPLVDGKTTQMKLN